MGKFACFVHRWLVPAGGLLFVVVGLAKVASGFGEAESLGKPDPVFGLVCLLGKSRLFRASLLLFAGSELLYRGNWMATSVLICAIVAGVASFLVTRLKNLNKE